MYDPNAPGYDEDVYGDIPCPKCGSYEIQAVSDAVYKSAIGIHSAVSEIYAYVAQNNDDSVEITENTDRFACATCLHEWPVDGKIYLEWID